MTKALQQVVDATSHLPAGDQDALAKCWLAEIESEQRWREMFADPRSDVLLKQLADEALEEHRRGETQPLAPETL